MMEAPRAFETLVDSNQSIRHSNQENRHLKKIKRFFISTFRVVKVAYPDEFRRLPDKIGDKIKPEISNKVR